MDCNDKPRRSCVQGEVGVGKRVNHQLKEVYVPRDSVLINLEKLKT